MYPEGIDPRLHAQLAAVDHGSSKVDVFYSNRAVHSKMYLWMAAGKVVSALSGSANFSFSGLQTPLKEILFDVNSEDFDAVLAYTNSIASNSISCLEHVSESVDKLVKTTVHAPVKASMTLLDPATNEVQRASGLNWAQNPRNHTGKSQDDGCIPIRREHIRDHPDLFFSKQGFTTVDGGRPHRANDPIEVIFDDGHSMRCLFEGSQTIKGVAYPKQISSYPGKDILGRYFRDRLGVPSGKPYGWTHIELSLIVESVYYMDFSVPSS